MGIRTFTLPEDITEEAYYTLSAYVIPTSKSKRLTISFNLYPRACDHWKANAYLWSAHIDEVLK
jgi:hypothetical protein